MILIVDNYDSFVHNLARYVREAGSPTLVVRNDDITIEGSAAREFSGVILSPGPGAPRDAGVCLSLLARLDAAMPVLGVCLGHQCLIEADGGRTIRAAHPLHGEASAIHHDGSGILVALPSPFDAGRYHSLVGVLSEGGGLRANAWSEQDEVMGVRHVALPRHGVQFHPESLLTPVGRQIIRNFLDLTANRP